MSYWMGIDGGGSNLRITITDDDLNILAQAQNTTVNPSVVGRALAEERIQTTVSAALSEIGLDAGALKGVGIGVAGASVAHSESWLRQIMRVIAPSIPAALSSDLEIALVGAHGKREGVLLLAGTGSAAYGINHAGESAQVGGWGYLVGDEGSSYWIGAKALQLLTRHADGRENLPDKFVSSILGQLEFTSTADLIPWLYRSPQPRTREVAALAQVVLAHADGAQAVDKIIWDAANELKQFSDAVTRRLRMIQPPIAFAGGLLESDNPLSQRLYRLLGLEDRPVSKYPPVIGAVLLAQRMSRGT